MKPKTKIWALRRLVAVTVAFVMLLVVGITPAMAASPAELDVERPVRADADTSFKGWLTIPESNVVAEALVPENTTLMPEESIELTVDVPSKGEYAIVLTYRPTEKVMLDSTVTVTLFGEEDQEARTSVYSIWQDVSKEYNLDRYGNEVTPSQTVLDVDITDYVRDFTSVDAAPVIFKFAGGQQRLKLLSNDIGVTLKGVKVVKYDDLLPFEEYKAAHSGSDYEGDTIIIEGEDYAVKSDSFIRNKAGANASVTPYNPYYKWLATVDGNAWNSIGQRVVWNFTVPEDGWYNLTFHYSQASKEGQDSCRSIEIDGVIPYEELRSVPFAYTGNRYAYKQVDGKVYLTKGQHTLGMYVEVPKMATFINEVQGLMETLQDIGLSLQQIAGSDADQTRSWEIETYLPGVTKTLESIYSRLDELYDELEEAYGEVPASSLNLQLASSMIKEILKKPEKLPTRTEEIHIGSGSATNLLAELINGWKAQGLNLDNIYLTADDAKLPNANGNFFLNIANSVKRFFFSLVSRNANYSASDVRDDAINVWVNRSVPYVETIQMLADSRYPGYTDANGHTWTVNFSIMPDEGKLLLANASNTCPDVALSVTGDRPYQLGLRSAATPLSDFADFEEFITDKFDSNAFEAYIYDGKVYAIPETQQVYTLMYRKDILDRLGIELPRTWDDVAELMPTLRRNGMNFYLPLSAQTGTKTLGNMSPFFYQACSAAGKNPLYALWSEDGMSINFNSEIGISSFQSLTDLYLLYGLQNNIPSFYNNFRYGVTPLGIGSFENYVQMLYAAPEIADQWSIAAVPGFEGEDGTVYNQMNTTDRSAIILSSSTKKEAAWDFIKWWMSDDAQTEFSQTLQAKFGSEFVWNSANNNAFENLAIPSDHRDTVLQQRNNTQNVRNTPATYMLERSLSNAWYDVVNEHVPVRNALNDAAVDVQLELNIKLREFGFMDEKFNKVKSYNMQSLEELLADKK
ncbi:MAG: extracellular solute-binding protein [Clostridia bacterium]|nr:extracellular solute-binding protein [Clostridia bacterium]